MKIFPKIKIQNASENNLKGVNLEIPKNQLVVFTGVSGSGKSSLAFDTIFAEGQRRYIESLSTYARQFLGQMDKPDVDYIDGLTPAISIDQKSTSNNPRSTVGTVTEIYDFLRLLYARIGRPHCPIHHHEIKSQTIEQMCNRILEFEEDTRVIILSPIAEERKGTFEVKKIDLIEVMDGKEINRINVDISEEGQRKYQEQLAKKGQSISISNSASVDVVYEGTKTFIYPLIKEIVVPNGSEYMLYADITDGYDLTVNYSLDNYINKYKLLAIC